MFSRPASLRCIDDGQPWDWEADLEAAGDFDLADYSRRPQP